MDLRLFWVVLLFSACGAQVTDPGLKDHDGAPGPDGDGIDSAPSTEQLPVDVIITADNAYGFGYGSVDNMANYFGGIKNTSAGEIFNSYGPETYVVPKESANAGDYLYVVAWSDNAVSNGVLATFTRGSKTIRSGDPEWAVCATGIFDDYAGAGPTQLNIQSGIDQCNANNGVSAGWKTIADENTSPGWFASGELNDSAAEDFPQVSAIETDARWMWYHHLGDANPFLASSGDVDGEFLLFRLPVEDLVTVD